MVALAHHLRERLEDGVALEHCAIRSFAERDLPAVRALSRAGLLPGYVGVDFGDLHEITSRYLATGGAHSWVAEVGGESGSRECAMSRRAGITAKGSRLPMSRENSQRRTRRRTRLDRRVVQRTPQLRTANKTAPRCSAARTRWQRGGHRLTPAPDRAESRLRKIATRTFFDCPESGFVERRFAADDAAGPSNARFERRARILDARRRPSIPLGVRVAYAVIATVALSLLIGTTISLDSAQTASGEIAAIVALVLATLSACGLCSIPPVRLACMLVGLWLTVSPLLMCGEHFCVLALGGLAILLLAGWADDAVSEQDERDG
jgi:hypothetical protein